MKGSIRTRTLTNGRKAYDALYRTADGQQRSRTFFKKKRAGYQMPIKITGTYEQPSFELDLAGTDAKTARKDTAHASQLLKDGKR